MTSDRGNSQDVQNLREGRRGTQNGDATTDKIWREIVGELPGGAMAITPGCIARKRTKKRHKEIRGLSEEEGRRGVADQKEQLQASGRETFGQIGG